MAKITEPQLDLMFGVRDLTAEQIGAIEKVREAAHEFAKVVLQRVPDGPDQVETVQQLRSAMAMGMEAIRCMKSP